MMVDWVLRKPVATDLAATRHLLDAEGLPTEDLTLDHLALLADGANGNKGRGEFAGAIGLEMFTDIGLLRSLVVANEYRSSGLGKALVAAVEHLALERGVNELWLLTIDADRWFAQQGYDTMARKNAPAAIRRTAEFSDLCPGDAVLMRKNLCA